MCLHIGRMLRELKTVLVENNRFIFFLHVSSPFALFWEVTVEVVTLFATYI